ncbi:MAG: sulfotransferase [Sphingomonadales bacterium]|nr:sulfotransferase [Sphingomonadales bacterium]
MPKTTVQDVLAAARAQTGLDNYSDAYALGALERLLDGYNTEARFTERGHGMAVKALVDAAATRMKIDDYLSRHPELLDRPIDKPMFVFGLPRTGTTLTINLLAADPARRSFLRWEIADPLPPATPGELHAGPRYEACQAQCEMAIQYMPHIAAIHMEWADSPTECQFLMTPSFVSQVYESQAYIPSYRHWFLHEADYHPAFAAHKRTLQVLQANTGGRWTLKNPWHPLFLDALWDTYPDAQLVMTHRDPAEVLGSACSLIKAVRPIYTDHEDLHAIGRDFVDTFEIMIQRMIAFREKHGWDVIHDVQYADTLQDPIGVVRGIYAKFDEPFTAEAEAAMTAYMADNQQGKHGKHSYRLEDYGLSKDMVHERFADYIARFRIPVKA